MSNDNQTSNSEKNELNEAVEQVNTKDSDTSSSQANNNQSTVSNTVATSSSSMDSQAAEERLTPSDANASDDSADVEDSSADQAEQSSAAAPAAAETESSNNEKSMADNKDEQPSDPEAKEANSESTSQDVSSGSQSVDEESSSEPQAEAKTTTNDAQDNPNSNSDVTGGAETTEPSTATNSEDFGVNVTTDNNADGVIDADDLALSDTATDSMSFNVDVTGVNDAPEAEHTELSGKEDNTIVITQADLLANASDVEGDKLVASGLKIDPSFGDVVDNGDGTFTFSPTADYNGDVPFAFSVSDGEASTVAHGNIDIAAVNDLPVFTEATFTVNEDNSIIINSEELLGNAKDVDGDLLSIDSISAADNNGTVTQNENGDWVFTPSEHFSGDAQLSVVINDGTATATFASVVEVDGVADTPSLSVSLNQITLSEYNDNGSILSDWSTDNASGGIEINPDYVYGVGDNRGKVLELEKDRGDESNIYQNLDIAAGDTVTLTFDISARAGRAGEDSQVDVYFEGVLIDSIQPDVGWESYSYTFTATTDNPRLELDSPSDNSLGAVLDVIQVTEPQTLLEDTVIDLNIATSLVDTDGSESMQSLMVGEIPAGAIISDGTQQFVATTDNDSVDVLGWDLSQLTITPAEDFYGEIPLEVTATSVEDANGDTASTTEVLTLDVANVNDAVVIDNDSPLQFDATEDTQFTITEAALLSNASDIDSDQLIVTNLSIPNATYVSVIDPESGDKSFVITLDDDFNGDIEMDFNVSDQDGSVVESGAIVNVAAVNDAAVAPDLAFSMSEDGIIVITDEQLLAGATDVDGDSLSIANVTYTGKDGVLTDNEDGTYSFAPNANFNGEMQLQFGVDDGVAVTAANIDITVDAVNDAPEAEHTELSGKEDNTIVITQADLLANASDVEGDKLVASGLKIDPSFGDVVDNGDGTFTFSPTADYNGDVPFAFSVSDGEASTVAHGNIDIAAVNDLPVFTEATFTVNEDNSIIINSEELLGNAKDVDGDLLSIDSISAADNNGTVTQNENGDWVFTPSEHFSGDAQLSVVINDGTATATFASVVEVDGVADTPSLSVSLNQITLSEYNDNGSILSDWSTDNASGGIETNPDYVYGVGDNRGKVLELEKDRGDESNIYQNLDIAAGDTVTLTFDISARAGLAGEDSQVDVYFEGVLIDSIQPDVGWESYSYTFTATTDNPRLELDSPSDNSLGAVLDVIQVTEPQTLLEDTVIDLNIATSLVDTDGSESMQSLMVGEIPAGAIISDGTQQFVATTDNDSVDVLGWDLSLLTITPAEDFYGEIPLEVTAISVEDANGDTASTTEVLTLDVANVNDAVVIDNDSPLQFDATEDTQFTITEAALLSNASDIDSDQLIVTNLSIPNATYVSVIDPESGDKSFVITLDDDFNGDIEMDFNVSDQDGSVVESGAIVSVAAVNDAPVAGDDWYIQGEEDQTVGVSLREEPMVRLDEQPDFGIVQANIDDAWVTLTVGQEFAANSEVRFVADESAVTDSTHTSLIGTFDDKASLDDWGNEVDSHTREFTDGDLVITTESTGGPLGAWNGNTHIGHGIGDDDDNGLSGNEQLVVYVEGQDINEISFELDGVGGWFVEGSNHFTEIEIRAFDIDGNLIDSQTYSKPDNSSFEHSYTLTTDVPVARFELGTIEGNGSYVVQNMSVSQTQPDNVVFTSIAVDGAEVTETIDLNIHAGEQNIDLSTVMPGFSSIEEGGVGFAPIIITEAQLLAQASDIDSENLDITNLALNDDNATLTDNGDGTWTVTPDENFAGEIDLTYQVSDGELTDTNTIHIDFAAVNDAPETSGPAILDTLEDNTVHFTDEDLLQNASDIEGDSLTIQDLTYSGNDGSLIFNDDGSYSFVPNDDFNGQVELSYAVSDGQLVTASELYLTVTPVNDAAKVEPVNFAIQEDETLLFTEAQLLAKATDVDGDDLSVSSVFYSGEQGELINNGNGTYSFVPNENFSGNIDVAFSVFDGTEETAQSIAVTIEAVADSPDLVVTTADGAVVTDDAIVVEPGSTTLLNIDANLVDIDLSETLTVEVGGLPEGSVLNYDGEDLLNDQSSGIVSYEDTDITVTFQGEGAGYQNTAGYYTVDENGTITGVQIGFENASQVGSGGDLVPGESSFTFDVSQGESFNLFVIPNGFRQNDFDDLQEGTYEFRDADGSIATIDSIDPQLVHISEDGSETVIQSQFGDAIFHAGTNNNLNEDGVAHTKTELNDAGEIVYGVEDIFGGGDEDFDDFTFTVDIGETNSQIYQGEIVIDETGSAIIPTIALEQELAVTFPDDYTGSTALAITATATELANDDQSSTVQVVNFVVDHAPESTAIDASINEDGTITLTQEALLANATDLDGDDLVALNVATDDPNVKVVDNQDGTYTVTPAADFNGEVALSFDVSDGDQTVTTALNLTVDAVNDLPTAPTINLSGTEDVSITIDPDYILSQATDVEGDKLTLDNLAVKQPANASLTQNQDGTYSLITPENFNGLVQLSYLISDESGEGVPGELAMDIIPVDDSPFQNGNAHLTIEEDGDVTFNEADLLALFGDVDSSLTIMKVHTADGEEADGSLTDNGNGTWTFTPTADFAGTADLQVIASDGNSEASIDLPVYIRPVADGTVITTAHDGPLVFAEDTTGHFSLNVAMLDASESMESLVMTGYPVGFVVSDGTHTVTITEQGQQVDISQWDLNDLSMTPPEDYNGNFFVTVTSVTLDEGDESSVEDDSQLLTDVQQPETFVMNDDGSVLIEANDLLEAESLDPDTVSVDSVSYSGDKGVLVDNDNDTWTFWSDPIYQGPVKVDFYASNDTEYSVDLEIKAVNDKSSSTSKVSEPKDESGVTIVTVEELLANVDGIEGDNLTVSNVQSDSATVIDTNDGSYRIEQEGEAQDTVDLTYNVSNGEDTVDGALTVNTNADSTEYDYTAAPGGSVNVSIPTEISDNSDVDHLVVSGLPEGVSPESAIEQGEDEYLISGDLSQPITLNIDDSFTGDINMDMSGVNSMDQPIDGANASVIIDVDSSYEMDGSSADSQPMTTGTDDGQSGDWTQSDNTDMGVDVMDDSASYDDNNQDAAADDSSTEVDAT
ncbi:tandem-95 repeat protein [Shewanella youngdeokensis]|uniref:Tandem-95 repeat protein n=1 Tax=Shewanella youngdeokensis TaxID=2999068 RepID=A0ABZ0K2N5_9GAMM|nr:tandem-95 repeat protein [Shewanella sp. DAU334]